MEYKKIGELTSVVTGGTPKTSHPEYWENGEIPWLQSGCCQNCDVYSSEKYITKEGYDNSSTRLMPADTVMIALTGATAGKIGYLRFEACGNQSITGIFPCNSLNQRYLFYFLISQRERILSDCIGGAQPHISQGYVKDIKIPIPTMEEQQSIVKRLETTRQLIDQRQNEIKLLDQLIKARFVEMFGNPASNNKGWDLKLIEDCLTSIDSGKSFVCDSSSRIGNKPGILKLSAVTYGVYNPNENKAMINDNDFISAAEVHDGDLLFTRKNTPELVGMAAYVESTPKSLMMPDLIFRLNTNKNCNKIYLWKLINHELYRPMIIRAASGSAKSMSNISKERLGKIKIPLPPCDLQMKFANFVTQVDKSRFVVQKALDEAQLLFDSLMQEYFG
ncbi:restriction endonuclease subunit S [Sharpea azabuensis]|uniref:restriction endonuclease subunit S n=1 Tax=Sharpea azabuensis TaxID=322505 RepID=UPI001566215C|nr:restriction endonuclease subunit S [Sharpea azabuensis]